MPDDELMREYVRLKQKEEREKRTEPMKKMLAAAGKMLPRGIRHPDSLVTNMHLYTPKKGKHKTKLF